MNVSQLIKARMLTPEALTEDEWDAATDIVARVPVTMFCPISGLVLDVRRVVVVHVDRPDHDREALVFHEDVADLLNIDQVKEQWPGAEVTTYTSRDLVAKLKAAA